MSKYFFLGLLSLGLVFTGCNDDDDDDDNTPGACATPTDLLVDDTEANSVTLSWTSTGSAWTIEYGETGFAQGSGTEVTADSNPFTVDGLMGDTDYDFYVRNNCADGSSSYAGPLSSATDNPIVGEWEAYDVGGTLSGAGVTEINATFMSNQQYEVFSTQDGAVTEFSGSYTVTGNDVAGIYEITLSQTTPDSRTAMGIVQVYSASPDSMWYEVVQTDPALTGVTPPTVSGGFGSTSGGFFGNNLVQKYLRVE
ncbi:fibronectin type III domain-containing protein [Cryomorphaceae bacterium 1068]|nr:fibronectin type III domain-containing protein [Cryomorphaceae bacterium 1068]